MKKYYKPINSIFTKLEAMNIDIESRLDILEERYDNKSEKWQESNAWLKLREKIDGLYHIKNEIEEAIEILWEFIC